MMTHIIWSLKTQGGIMKSSAWKKGLALVASVWLGGAHAELVTDQVGRVADLGFRECVVLTCVPGAPEDYYLRVGVQAMPATFTASNGGYQAGNDIGSLDGLVSALYVTNLTLGTADGATQIVDQVFDASYEEFVRTAYSVGLQTASITRDTSDSSVAAIGLKGGFTWSGSRINGVLIGGTVTFNDLRIDLDRQMITADVRGQSLGASNYPSQGVGLNDIDLFTIGQISGPSVFAPVHVPTPYFGPRTFEDRLNPEDYDATYTFSGLGLADEGLAAITTALGLGTTGKTAFAGVQYAGGIGSLSVRLAYGPVPVPEPATYALLGVGLLGLWVGVRRNAAKNG